MRADAQARVSRLSSMVLLPSDFTFRTILPSGVEVEMNAVVAKRFCDRLDAFGDDCSDACKQMRNSIRAAIAFCEAGGTEALTTSTETQLREAIRDAIHALEGGQCCICGTGDRTLFALGILRKASGGAA